MRLRLLLLTLPLSLLAACDQLGIDSPQKVAERLEADAKAVGSACRQAGRAIEDCYSLNPKASKAAVFAGWRDMDEYMRENKLDVVKPSLNPVDAQASHTEASASDQTARGDQAGDTGGADGTDSPAAASDAQSSGHAAPVGRHDQHSKGDLSGKSSRSADQPARRDKPADTAP